jgi:hypothetical protein
LEVGDLKIVAHPFREKYRWRLEKREDFLFELVDLRDALLERKKTLILYILLGSILYPLLGRRIVRNFTKLIDTERYVRLFFREGWRSKVVGGLDHHVKFYLREVRKRVMIPDYSLSFSMMRNFLLSRRKVKDKEEFLKAMRSETSLISFSEKPSFVWVEGDSVKVSTPYSNTYLVLLSASGLQLESIGSNAHFSSLDKDFYVVLGYTYGLKVGRLLLGVRPLFVSDLLEVS